MKWLALYLAVVIILLIWNHARCLQVSAEAESDQVAEAE